MLTTCKHFDTVGNRCSRVTDGKCDDLPDCEFKYIEELKAEIETLKKVKDFACINLKNYIADNNKLKAENEKLEEATYSLLNIQYALAGSCKKYSETLQEIKAIADAMYEDYSKRWDDNISEGLEQIIDLINKAEEE